MKSFNAWLKEQAHDNSPFKALAMDWLPRRGVVTKASAERRAQELGFQPGEGASAFEAYTTYLSSNP